jgi:hypothetical protein
MSRFWLGTVCGLAFGVLSAASMLPLSFPDKRAALLGAFLSRFAVGVAIGASVGSPQLQRLGVPAWVVGVGLGLLISAPDAAITKAYGPILGLGAVGGAAIGWIVGRWGA